MASGLIRAACPIFDRWAIAEAIPIFVSVLTSNFIACKVFILVRGLSLIFGVLILGFCVLILGFGGSSFFVFGVLILGFCKSLT